jgi:hypothetical protein
VVVVPNLRDKSVVVKQSTPLFAWGKEKKRRPALIIGKERWEGKEEAASVDNRERKVGRATD